MKKFSCGNMQVWMKSNYKYLYTEMKKWILEIKLWTIY